MGNPNLEATTSDNFDPSVEYYYPSFGQLSIGGYHKRINDFIVQSTRRDYDMDLTSTTVSRQWLMVEMQTSME